MPKLPMSTLCQHLSPARTTTKRLQSKLHGHLRRLALRPVPQTKPKRLQQLSAKAKHPQDQWTPQLLETKRLTANLSQLPDNRKSLALPSQAQAKTTRRLISSAFPCLFPLSVFRKLTRFSLPAKLGPELKPLSPLIRLGLVRTPPARVQLVLPRAKSRQQALLQQMKQIRHLWLPDPTRLCPNLLRRSSFPLVYPCKLLGPKMTKLALSVLLVQLLHRPTTLLKLSRPDLLRLARLLR